MDERRAVEALIDRLVREADLPSRRARAELRRELESHFDAAGDSPEALRDALARFGATSAVSQGLRRAHRRGRLALYAAKVAASLVISVVTALVLQTLVNLRLDLGAAAVRLGPGFPISMISSAAIVLVLVAAWELGFEPLCVRLERDPARLLATLAAFFAVIFSVHLATDTLIAPRTALLAGGMSVAVWTCTVAILARLDLAYLRLFGTEE